MNIVERVVLNGIVALLLVAIIGVPLYLFVPFIAGLLYGYNVLWLVIPVMGIVAFAMGRR